MRLRLLSRNCANNLERAGIDGGDSLIQFRGYIKKTAVRIVNGIMRPNAMAEIDVPDYFPRGDIDHEHVAPIASRFSNARIAIDWSESGAPIGRSH